MKAIILEDEPIAMRRMKRLLTELFSGQIELVAEFSQVSELGNYLINNPHPDVLFLDVMVEDGNSFDLFDLVDVHSKVIFVTAFDKYAIDAFRKNAVDYLLKPIKKDLLIEAVNKVKSIDSTSISGMNLSNSPFKQRFLIRFGNKLNSIRTSSIAYVYAEGKLAFFILKDGVRVSSDLSLQTVNDALDPHLFFRVNRQFVVHIDAIEDIVRHSRSRLKLKLNPAFNDDIVISTNNTPNFKSWMDR